MPAPDKRRHRLRRVAPITAAAGLAAFLIAECASASPAAPHSPGQGTATAASTTSGCGDMPSSMFAWASVSWRSGTQCLG